jgi:4,5-dihydroxyphthalate decarboxylase
VPPPGLRLSYIPPSTDIGAMLVAGELDATLLYITDTNLVDRSRIDISKSAGIKQLFPDAIAEGRRYYAATGVQPMNHGVVVRRKLYAEHPWIVLNLFKAFRTAKELALREAVEVIEPHIELGLVDDQSRAGLKKDALPYSLRESRKTLELLSTFLHEQGLTKRPVAMEELFAKQTLDL